MPQLNQPCSKHFTYRQLIECGETWQSSSIDNLPLADQSWQALADLATHILDPVYEQFGNIGTSPMAFVPPHWQRQEKNWPKHRACCPPSTPHWISTAALKQTGRENLSAPGEEPPAIFGCRAPHHRR